MRRRVFAFLLYLGILIGASLAFLAWRYDVPVTKVPWRALLLRYLLRPRERVTPGDRCAEVEHVARYRWAQQFCAGKRVADIASGTGYGMKILAEVASSVDGYDKEPLGQQYVIDLEKQAWMERYDTIVSFETIEHLANPDFFLENARKTTGLLLLSTPVGERPDINKYHKQFWTFDKLKSLLDRFFSCDYLFQTGERIHSSPHQHGTVVAVCKPRYQ